MKLRAKLRRVQADLAWLGLICFVVVLVLRWALRADTSLRVVLAPLLVYLPTLGVMTEKNAETLGIPAFQRI